LRELNYFIASEVETYFYWSKKLVLLGFACYKPDLKIDYLKIGEFVCNSKIN